MICRRGDCAVFGSSVIDDMLRVLFFFLFPFVNVLRSNKPCTTDL